MYLVYTLRFSYKINPTIIYIPGISFLSTIRKFYKIMTFYLFHFFALKFKTSA